METILEFLRQPWPWWVAGPLIALTMMLLMWFGKTFGISATLRTMCAAMGGRRWSELFNFDWKQDMWNIVFILGSITGGMISTHLLNNDNYFIDLNPDTTAYLQNMGVSINEGLIPYNLFAFREVFTLRGFILMVIGGFLIGFGTRYAGGCTSGHAISGLSNLQLPSLVAVIGFFLGGLIMTHLLLPYILQL